jgi:hypothetical protein
MVHAMAGTAGKDRMTVTLSSSLRGIEQDFSARAHGEIGQPVSHSGDPNALALSPRNRSNKMLKPAADKPTTDCALNERPSWKSCLRKTR